MVDCLSMLIEFSWRKRLNEGVCRLFLSNSFVRVEQVCVRRLLHRSSPWRGHQSFTIDAVAKRSHCEKTQGALRLNASNIQDLKSFRLPPEFRGRSGIVVQLWWLVQATLFRASPQVMYGFRRWLLRRFGAQIGAGVRIRPSVTIPYPWKLQIGDHAWVGDQAVLYCFAKITIGKNAVVSQKSYLCAGTHDYRSASFDIQAFPIVIEEEAWLAADVFIAPGVTVGRGAVVGSRSSVFSDLPPMMVCVGSPARPVRSRL